MEIERKFLVKELPAELEKFEVKQLTQAYVSADPVIRIRQSNLKYYLTVKTKGYLAREEVEFEINLNQYNSLMQKVDSNIISKKRYLIPLDARHTAELDIYEGFLQGLKTVEVEFDSEEEALDFTPPEWFGRDVTFDGAYKNSNLAQFGLPKE